MTQLIILDAVPSQLDCTSFGGLPVQAADSPIEWPACTQCNGLMQYQAKVKTELGLELIFMCVQEPGMCDDWNANGGGNKVIVVENTQDLVQLKPENTENTLRETEYGAKLVQDDLQDYFASHQQWASEKREILGQLGGTPDWIQNDETPECNCCNLPMRFVAQLEEGPDYKTAMNFGSGSAYLFDCVTGKTAKFLWQC